MNKKEIAFYARRNTERDENFQLDETVLVKNVGGCILRGVITRISRFSYRPDVLWIVTEDGGEGAWDVTSDWVTHA